MSDPIGHECGIAFIRLRKPLEYYNKELNKSSFALRKLFVLMEKQKNRGQDGAGVACVRLGTPPGSKFIFRSRSKRSGDAIRQVFNDIDTRRKAYLREVKKQKAREMSFPRDNAPFEGEIYLGHLRYGTYGKYSLQNIQPVKRANSWKSRNLVLAGNFNLSNVSSLMDFLVEELGQEPMDNIDTIAMLENVGHFLDSEVEHRFQKEKETSEQVGLPLSRHIENSLDWKYILRRSSEKWDGGYVVCGITGHGASFILRDPNGIRPAYWYADDDIVIVASERPAIQTAMGVPIHKVQELKAGAALTIDVQGDYKEIQIRKKKKRASCSFERIYFSRGNDSDIYQERKRLGKLLVTQILGEVNNNWGNTVFSFIPNTAQAAFFGLVEGLKEALKEQQYEKLRNPNLTDEQIKEILSVTPRTEMVAVKDEKMRTFITSNDKRGEMVRMGYDVIYGSVTPQKDTLVIIDDSIVRGNTLRENVLKTLDRSLSPKAILVASSAPQIRYPDCYGIDMSNMADLCAFVATKKLLIERGMEDLLNETLCKCKEELKKPRPEENHVQAIYAPLTTEEISEQIAKDLTSKEIKAKIKVVYQSIENLHLACPNHQGDWYFSGNYPTKGGIRSSLQAFVYAMENKNERPY